MNGWQAVVFDLDDTLFPERDYVKSGFRAVAAWAEARLGVPAGQGFCELSQLFERGVRGETFNRWLAGHGVAVDRALISEMVAVYRDHEPARLRPFPEVLHVLGALKRRLSLGLLSDGFLAVQQRKLAALGLAPYFEAIVFSDQWGRDSWKPSRKPFLAVMENLGVAPEKAVYVGDNPLKDFRGARELGMATVRVCRENGEYAALAPPGKADAPDFTIASLEALPCLQIC